MELLMLLLVSLLPVYIAPHDMRSRCRCINTTANFRPKQFEKIQVTPPTSSCNHTEIIVTVNSNRHCLSPNTVIGRIIFACWKSNASNLRSVKPCVKNKWKQVRNKTKNLRRKRRKTQKARKRS